MIAIRTALTQVRRASRIASRAGRVPEYREGGSRRPSRSAPARPGGRSRRAPATMSKLSNHGRSSHGCHRLRAGDGHDVTGQSPRVELGRADDRDVGSCAGVGHATAVRVERADPPAAVGRSVLRLERGRSSRRRSPGAAQRCAQPAGRGARSDRRSDPRPAGPAGPAHPSRRYRSGTGRPWAVVRRGPKSGPSGPSVPLAGIGRGHRHRA